MPYLFGKKNNLFIFFCLKIKLSYLFKNFKKIIATILNRSKKLKKKLINLIKPLQRSLHKQTILNVYFVVNLLIMPNSKELHSLFATSN